MFDLFARQPTRWLLPAVLLLTLSGYVWHQKATPSASEASSIQIVKSDCNLNTHPCTTVLAPGQTITLSLSPRPVRYLDPFDLQMAVQGIRPMATKVRFQGVDMDMGLIEGPLTERRADQWQGQIALPVCIQGKMSWAVQLALRTPDGTRTVQFLLNTEGGH